MLTFIKGVTQRARSAEVRRLIELAIKSSGRKVCLIVPEQFSFETEKALLSLFPSDYFRDLTVTSFSALALKFGAGSSVKRHVDAATKPVVMSLACEKAEPELKICSAFRSRVSCVRDLVRLYNEIYSCLESGDEISVYANRPEVTGLLRQKLEDLAIIIGEYERIAPPDLTDASKNLRLLCSGVMASDAFADTEVFVDGFYTFTRAEKDVLVALAAKSREVVVTVPGDRVPRPLFALCEDQTALISSKAREIGVRTEERFVNVEGLSNPIFDQVAEAFLSDSPLEFRGDVPIEICETSDIPAECEFVCIAIKKLLLEEQYRLRDITVVADENMSVRLASAFDKFNIPNVRSTDISLKREPIVRVLTSLFNIVADGFDTTEIMTYLRSGASGLNEDEINELEEYALSWRISGRKWTEDFTGNPSGFGTAFGETERKKLDILNDIRRRAVGPLEELTRAMRRCSSGEETVEAFWSFIENTGFASKLEQIVSVGPELRGGAVEPQAVWNAIVAAISNIHSLVGKEKLDVRRLRELWLICIGSVTLKQIPTSADGIIISDPSSIRTENPRCVIITGAAEGVFPESRLSSGLFDLDDRAKLRRIGMLDIDEGYFASTGLVKAFSLVTAPSRKLIVTWHRREAGEELVASSVIETLAAAFPDCRKYKYPDNFSARDKIWSTECALSLYAESVGLGVNPDHSSPRNLAAAVLEGRAEYEDRLSALDRFALRDRSAAVASISGNVIDGAQSVRITDRSLAKDLLANRYSLSPSSVEAYFSCPFKYFCNYGIRLRTRRDNVIDVRIRGNIVHHAFEKILGGDMLPDDLLALGEKGLSDKIVSYFREYADLFMGGFDSLSAREKHVLMSLAQNTYHIAAAVLSALSAGSFTTAAVEFSTGPEGNVPALEVASSSGSRAIVTGKVDRVDLWRNGGDVNVRIIDYKTGGKKFERYKNKYGLDLQMLIYLITLYDHPSESLKAFGQSGELRPAGILYVPSVAKDYINDRDATEEQIMKKELENASMNGYIADSPEVVRAMGFDDEELAGKKAGTVQTYSYIEFEDVRKLVFTKLLEMVDSIEDGIYDMLPIFNCNKKHCEYCDYKKICAPNDNMSVRNIAKGADK